MKSILVTGSSGFIGFHVVRKLLESNFDVYGIDNMNSNYDVSLKKARLNKVLEDYKEFKFKQVDIADEKSSNEIFKGNQFDCCYQFSSSSKR